MIQFVACSPKHRQCSPSHAELVRGYQRERERQERAVEYEHSYRGDRALWEANGGSLITFKQWLLGNKTH